MTEVARMRKVPSENGALRTKQQQKKSMQTKNFVDETACGVGTWSGRVVSHPTQSNSESSRITHKKKINTKATRQSVLFRAEKSDSESRRTRGMQKQSTLWDTFVSDFDAVVVVLEKSNHEFAATVCVGLCTSEGLWIMLVVSDMG